MLVAPSYGNRVAVPQVCVGDRSGVDMRFQFPGRRGNYGYAVSAATARSVAAAACGGRQHCCMLP